MVAGLLQLLGLTGVARDTYKSVKFDIEADRLGSPLLVGCKNIDDVIRKKMIHRMPLTEGEMRRMEDRAKVETNLSQSYYDLYYNNTGKSLSDVVEVAGQCDLHKHPWTYGKDKQSSN